MSTDNIDTQHLEVYGSTGVHGALTVQSGVQVIVNQAYGPTGAKLIGRSDIQFDGYPALSLFVRADSIEGMVHLSPIHGDTRKIGMEHLAKGSKCQLICPQSKRPLDKVRMNDELSGPEYFAIYLSPDLRSSSMVFISDTWGHYHSRIVHNDELVSIWLTPYSD